MEELLKDFLMLIGILPLENYIPLKKKVEEKPVSYDGKNVLVRTSEGVFCGKLIYSEKNKNYSIKDPILGFKTFKSIDKLVVLN